MPICGLVLTVTDQPPLRAALESALRADGRLTLGPAHGARWPVVSETEDPLEEEALLEALSRTPGVLMVEVAYHDFSDVEEVPGELTGRRRRGRRGAAGSHVEAADTEE